MSMSLWTLIEDYCRETGATEAAVMRRAGLNKGTFTAWRRRGVPALPDQGDLLGLAEALRCDYNTILESVLHDTEYLPEAAARSAQRRDHGAPGMQRAARRTPTGRATRGQQHLRSLDSIGEESQDPGGVE